VQGRRGDFKFHVWADIVGGAKPTVKVKELAKSGVGTAVMTHLLLKFHSLYFHVEHSLVPRW